MLVSETRCVFQYPKAQRSSSHIVSHHVSEYGNKLPRNVSPICSNPQHISSKICNASLPVDFLYFTLCIGSYSRCDRQLSFPNHLTVTEHRGILILHLLKTFQLQIAPGDNQLQYLCTKRISEHVKCKHTINTPLLSYKMQISIGFGLSIFADQRFRK